MTTLSKWQRATLPPTATLREAIRNLNEVAIRIVLVVDDNGILAGTISDGDIRRGLLRGLSLDSPITEVVKREPLVVPVSMSREFVVQLMTANKIHQVPVVDLDGRLVGLHLWEDCSSPPMRRNLMVIMAGGKGTRLRPHTECCPKPMLPVAGRPMLEYIIERGAREGFTDFVLTIHYLGEMVESHFGNGEKFNVRIDYVKESSPLGTAGALALLKPRPQEPFVVTNGDVLTDIRYGELLDFHMHHQAAATMAVRLHEWQHAFGVVRMKGVDIVGFEEKPVTRCHINAGVYALDPTALNSLQEGQPCDMPGLFETLQSQGRRIVAYPVHEPWLDVGRPDDLHRANTLNNISQPEQTT